MFFRSAASVKAHVLQLLRGISQENQDVRHYALIRLRQVLHQHQDIFHEFMLASETVDPLVLSIINAVSSRWPVGGTNNGSLVQLLLMTCLCLLQLLDGCRDSDPELRPLYGECLGELGAVDPGRLDSLATAGAAGDKRKFQASVMDPGFRKDFMTSLCQAYLRHEDRTSQDCVAFAIQELGAVYGIVSDPKVNTPGSKLYQKFSEEIREIMEPLLKTK